MSPEPSESKPGPGPGPGDEEDRARAGIYALLARLFYAAPDADLLQAIVSTDQLLAGEAATPVALAWRDLKRACAASSEAAAREEYDSLFVGTGKAVVTLYLGAYAPRSGTGAFLVELKGFFASRALARREAVKEPEDHVAAVFEVMRHFIAEDGSSLEEQKAFFSEYVWSGAIALCDAIAVLPEPRLYNDVARFARCFLELDRRAFEIY